MSTYLIYKPFGMLSQFTKEIATHTTLADLDYSFEKDVYPIGRLDADSEGLLLLSNDKRLNASVLDPMQKQAKTYWVQVEGTPTDQDLEPLRKGLIINLKGSLYHTLPCEAAILEPPIDLPDRYPPIRVRKNIPDTWLAITLIEGKNRQVRKMCAAIGFPVLRLVRAQLLSFELGQGICRKMYPGMVVQLDNKLKIKD